MIFRILKMIDSVIRKNFFFFLIDVNKMSKSLECRLILYFWISFQKHTCTVLAIRTVGLIKKIS